ncbi:MAG: UDP-N-acetylmuramoyl-tripeptide--D-alanyl-D-alanine ligase [Proteobacteria bacterium]|nr:UDP-N-acetylmuramoyl-tripeptide--D-alanyl-D-alanine ligase [Pseudomonadota bacterium]
MWSAEFLAKAAVGRLHGAPAGAHFTSVSIDTRTLEPGALYVALRGANFDGHRFIDAAIARGARGIVAAAPITTVPDGVAVIEVSDTLLALQMMGHAARRQFAGSVIAITGSNGKTTTRQLTASVLREHFGDTAVLATEGNYNNHIGVPLTLLRLRPSHRVAVIEMGMNHFGELGLLSSLAQPDIAVITNAAPAHLEGVGSLSGVACAKGEVFAGVAREGVAIINGDDAFASYWQAINRERRVVRFGFDDAADVMARYSASEGALELRRGWPQPFTAALPFAGEHNGRNALAAATVGMVLGVPADAVVRGLGKATNIGGRLTRHTLTPTLCVIDDSYNANPASMRAAVQVLLQEHGIRVLVIGDMAELGAHSDALHRALLAEIERTAVEHVFTLGPRMHAAAQSLAGRAVTHRDLDVLMDELNRVLDGASPTATTVLVKGAHSMAMHRVAERLAARVGVH